MKLPIPESWNTVQLGKGYTISFPATASSKTGEDRSVFALDTDEIIYTCEVRDMSDDAGFQKMKAEKLHKVFEQMADAFGSAYRRDIQTIDVRKNDTGQTAYITYSGANNTKALAKIISQGDLLYTAFTSIYIPATDELVNNANVFIGSLDKE